jgi:hypothetical protein
MMRHFLQRGTVDTDGTRHSAKMVWRALALLQKEIEGEREQKAVGPGEVVDLRQPCPHPGGRYCVYCDGGVREDVKTVMDDHHVNYMPARPTGLQP